MKRPTYSITYTCNGLQGLAHRHAWNSAVRETEKLAGMLAREHEVALYLTDSTSLPERVAGRVAAFTHGSRTWATKDGAVKVRFEIKLVTEQSRN